MLTKPVLIRTGREGPASFLSQRLIPAAVCEIVIIFDTFGVQVVTSTRKPLAQNDFYNGTAFASRLAHASIWRAT